MIRSVGGLGHRRVRGPLRLFLALSAGALLGGSACGSENSVTGSSDPEIGSFRSDTTSLGYTLERPQGGGPFPLIVFVHGSGPTTRDEMRNLVPRFLELGFAVFRYDKRGIGQSGGTYRGVGPLNSPLQIPELAGDAAAALQWGCSRPGIDATRCGYFGASQAGWVIPEAMERTANASFGVLFSGVTIPVGAQILFNQITNQAGVTLDSAYRALAAFTGVPGYDPTATLARMSRPTLWLLGLEDRLLPNEQAIRQLETLAAGGLPFQVKGYPGYGHSLGPAVWGDIATFLTPFRSR